MPTFRLAFRGWALIRVASYLAQPYLQSGALVACLEQAASDLPLSLVYPQNRYLPPAVLRAFYDWSRRVLQPPHSEARCQGIGPAMAAHGLF